MKPIKAATGPGCKRRLLLRKQESTPVRPIDQDAGRTAVGICLMVRHALVLVVTLLGTGSVRAGEASPRFEYDVVPILRARCWTCHGAGQRKGGLSLQTLTTMLEGGDSGPALVKGKVDESLIIEQVESGAMPPGKAEKLSRAEVATLKAWIAAGSPIDGTTSAEVSAGDEPVHW